MAIQLTDGTDTHTFVTLNGAPSPLAPSVESITRPGVDGHAARKLGNRSETFVMNSLADVATTAAVETTEDGYRAMRGKLVTITDSFNNSRENVLVEDVTITGSQAVTTASGGLNASPAAIVRAAWTFRIMQ